MSIASKLSAGLFAAACVCSLTAAEIVSIKEPADFMTPKRVFKDGESVLFKGNGTLLSAQKLVLDPAKKYQISGEFRLKDGQEGAISGNIYFGYVPYDANNKEIHPFSLIVVPKSATVIAKEAKKGDKVVYVKDASKWNMKTPYGGIAFNVKDDYSDLPNRDVIGVRKGNIKQNGDVWEITLNKPLTKDIAEGTKVRQQMSGATYIYNSPTRKAKSDWGKRTGVISGRIAKTGNPSNQLWPGTAYVRVMVLVSGGKPTDVLEMKNIKVEEVE